MTDGAVDVVRRLRELARWGALGIHYSYWRYDFPGKDRQGHDTQAFETCPHPDCVLVREREGRAEVPDFIQKMRDESSSSILAESRQLQPAAEGHAEEPTEKDTRIDELAEQVLQHHDDYVEAVKRAEEAEAKLAAGAGTPPAEQELTFAEFSRANRARCESPQGFNHKLADWDTSDWFLAVMGELGEAANVAKKLNRVRDGIPGNRETPKELRAKLRKEAGDVYVYLDLLAQAHNFAIHAAAVEVFNAKSKEIGYSVELRAGASVPAFREQRIVEQTCSECGGHLVYDDRDQGAMCAHCLKIDNDKFDDEYRPVGASVYLRAELRKAEERGASFVDVNCGSLRHMLDAYRQAERLRAGVAVPAVPPQWLPIESAPRDGRFLVADAQRRIMVADGKMIELSRQPGIPFHLSGRHWIYWMPLPDPPRVEASAAPKEQPAGRRDLLGGAHWRADDVSRRDRDGL